MSVGVIRIAVSDQCSCLSASGALSSLASLRCHPFPRHDVARSFLFCEPKTEVKIAGTIHLLRDKKIPKKFQKPQPIRARTRVVRPGYAPMFDDDGRLLISSAGRSADRRQIASPSSAVVGGAFDVIGLG
jgi:hypothetical protein